MIRAKVEHRRPCYRWFVCSCFCRARYGLRCPSEHLSLKWGDVDWEQNRITISSPKTTHHASGESRVIPLFPELRPHLRGDTDLDHDVDTVDLTGMIMNYNGATGNGGIWSIGDTDTVDRTTTIINFTSASNAAGAVPEPSGLLLLVLAVGCLVVARGSSCRRYS